MTNLVQDEQKILSKLKTTKPDQTRPKNVQNGIKKVNSVNKNYNTEDKILETMKSIKLKNCEGSDRIPQRMLVDGAIALLPSLAILFNNVYRQVKIPESIIQHGQSKMQKLDIDIG